MIRKYHYKKKPPTKIHFEREDCRTACGRLMYSNTTHDLAAVTCSRCLKKLEGVQ